MTNHAVVHVEFAADDPKAAGEFYGQLFGWSIQHNEQFDYVMYEGPSGTGGGFNKVGSPLGGSKEVITRPGTVLVYISTEDIEATLARVESLGGRRLVGKTEIPGMGWYAIFADPTGNPVGLFTGGPQAG